MPPYLDGRFVDLAAHRREKAARQARGRTVPWRVTHAQYNRACELVAQIQSTREGTDLYMALVDELKSIPGYPMDCDPERDTLYFTITTATPTTVRR